MKFLIIKTGALGDVLRSSFIAQGLVFTHGKKTSITWMTAKGAKPLLKNNPFIDRIISDDQRQIVAKESFDVVINLEEDEENVRFASSINARKRVGFVWRKGKIVPSKTAKEWFDMSLVGKRPQNDMRKIANKKTHNELISKIVGLPPNKFESNIWFDESDKAFTKRFSKKFKVTSNDVVIGVNVGSSGRWKKQLPVAKTIQLINQLAKIPRAKIVLFGGKEEIKRNKEITSKVKAKIIDPGCNLSLREFAAAMSLCKVVICTDTLGLHVSLALKRKTIAIIGPTLTAEIGMKNLGPIITPKSDCLRCLKPSCDSMQKTSVAEIVRETKKLLGQKIAYLITSFKEPKTIGRAIQSALDQDIKAGYEVYVSAPDPETISEAKKFEKKFKNVTILKDPGKGKVYAINQALKKISADILILTDGDVYVNKKAIGEIVKEFEDPLVGCVTGRPVPLEDKSTMYGYWANFLFDAAHKMRLKSHRNETFLEGSGYLFAFRKNQIEKLPLHVAEDTVVPYYFFERGYKVRYVPSAQVFVKNVNNWKEWISQKVRTSKGHETLYRYVNIDQIKREKSFTSELQKGVSHVVSYPSNPKEFFWTLLLSFARLYMWIKVTTETHVFSKDIVDGWESVESTK